MERPESCLSLRDKVHAALGNLDASAREIVLARIPGGVNREIARLMFGLTPGGAEYNRDEIARMFRLTRERVRQKEENITALFSLMEIVQDASSVPLA